MIRSLPKFKMFFTTALAVVITLPDAPVVFAQTRSISGVLRRMITGDIHHYVWLIALRLGRCAAASDPRMLLQIAA